MGSLETLKPYHQMKDEEGIVINDNTKYYGGIRIFSGKQTETPSMTTNFENIHENKYSSNSISIDDAVELLGAGRFQTIVLLATGLCFMADSMEISLLAFLSFILKDEWGLTSNEAASITSFVFVGEIIGALVLGKMGDKYGRRPILLVAAATICISGVVTAIADNYISLLILRFFVGFGVGGLTVPFDIFAEFLPLSLRGKYLLMINYFWTAGSLLVTIFAYLTIGTGEKDSWRLFVVLCTLPCFFSVIISYIYVPESPRWLLSQGKKEEAIIILRSAAFSNGKLDMYQAGLVLKEEEEVESSSFRELLNPKWRRFTLLLWGVWFGFGFSYNGVVMAITRVFKSDVVDFESTVTFNFGAIAISSLAEFIGVFIAVITVDSIGRIKSQIWFYSLGGITIVAMLWISPSSTEGEGLKIVLAIATRCFELSACCITWVTAAEVLKTEIRATGHSAANAVARVGAVLASYTVEGDTSLFTLGIFMIIIHLLTVGCVAFLPETKGLALGTTSLNGSQFKHPRKVTL